MKNKKYFAFVILAMICVNCIAQNKEYIVTFDNDTIYGKVKRKVDYGTTYAEYNFKFKDSNKKNSVIKPNEVRLFHTIDGQDGDAYFVSRDKHFFLERVFDGKIKFYKSVGEAMGDSPTYYYIKDNSILRSTKVGTTFARKTAHTQIRKLLEDKPELLVEFDSLKGSLENIKYIIEKYNNAK